jgi:tripartite-type tricarboxylate transporter receptor subunit TctC
MGTRKLIAVIPTGETMKNRVGIILTFALGLSLVLFLVPAMAQNWPIKPIKIVVGFPPGGANDTVVRLVAQKLAERVGQPVIVDNKPGADGIIATEYVARSAPDGYTLLTGASGQMTFNPLLQAKLPYDPVKDFTPVTMLYADPLVIAVNPAVPANSIKELIALARAKPGSLFYASAAPPFYVALEDFKKRANVNIVNVPYKGSGQAIVGAISGDAPMIMLTAGSLLPQIKAGKLRPLAVTGDQRDSHLPDTPTMAEIGMPMRGGSWSGLFVPSGTPRPIVEKLYSELAVVLKSDYMRDKVAAAGYGINALGATPAEFDTFYKSEVGYWTKVVQDLHLGPKKAP